MKLKAVSLSVKCLIYFVQLQKFGRIMYVCMYVCKYVCMYIFYLPMRVRAYARVRVRTYARMYVHIKRVRVRTLLC